MPKKNKYDDFERVIAELLLDPNFRKAVCGTGANQGTEAQAEAEIGKHKWNQFTQKQKDAIIKIACDYDTLTTTDIDNALTAAGSSSSYYFTDW